MKQHYELILAAADKRVKKALRHQVVDKSNRFYGGFLNDHGVVMVKHTVYKTSNFVTVYCNEGSEYYRNDDILSRIWLGFDFILDRQHASGLFDYETCNFEAAPDTAFILKKLLPIYQYLSGKGCTEEEKQILDRLDQIIRKGAEGLMTGGFHTPNHRWAIASVLAICGKIFNEPAYLEETKRYLVEGVDCNDDGEFAERSAGNYNRINNDAMMMIGQGIGDDSYDEYAIRNLKMMQAYIEPDGSVFTANSTRFDKDLKIFPKDYYWEYLYLGNKYNNESFLATANKIMALVVEHQLSAPDFLMNYMNHPALIEVEYEGQPSGETICRYFEESGIGRYINDRISVTVLKDKSNSLYIHNGAIQMEVKLAGSYFEHRAFKPETIQMTEDGGFILSQTMKGWYYLPFEEAQETSDWWKMDQSKRQLKDGPILSLQMKVTPVGDTVTVDMSVEGVKDAPFRVELAFSGIKSFETEHLSMNVTGAEAVVIKDGTLKVASADSALEIGPAFGAHNFTEGKEDSDVKNPGCATAYFTDYTPFSRSFTIQNS